MVVAFASTACIKNSRITTALFELHWDSCRAGLFLRGDYRYDKNDDVWPENLKDSLPLFQHHMTVHLLSHQSEPYYSLRRHFIAQHTSNEYVLKKKRFKFLGSNSHCLDRGRRKTLATCYYDEWLHWRLLSPFNCTLFYLTRGVEGYEVCDPDLVVRNFDRISNRSLKGIEVNRHVRTVQIRNLWEGGGGGNT